MIDYFALLEQPRAPWLDLDQLKNAYHKKTLHAHPDAQPSGEPKSSIEPITDLNEAYQVLRDPKRRLYHLITLEKAAPPSDGTVPSQLFDLFPAIGAVTQRANLVLEKIQTTSNNLSRSLLKPEILKVQTETKAVRQKIQEFMDAALIQLREINAGWAKSSTDHIDALSDLYLRFAYLGRWSKQLDEILFQLSLH